jgi:predicted phage-related endonuclease
MIEHWPIDPTPEGREEWLAGRKPFVSASSDVPAIFGVHPYKTTAGVHAEKMGLDIPGPDPNSSVIRRGHALEGVGAKEVALQHPEWDIVEANEMLVDRALRVCATPDRYLKGDPRGLGILEIKTVSSGKFKSGAWGDPNEPTPPLWILLQIATQLMLADAAFGVVGVLVIGDYTFETNVIEVPRLKSVEHRIRVAVKCFWAALEAGQVPTVDYERDADLLKLMYPREVAGKVIDLRGDNRIVELCEIRARNAAMIAVAEKAKKAAETEMHEKLGDAEIAMVQGWKVSLKTTHRPEVVQKAVDYRVLRTSRIEEDA